MTDPGAPWPALASLCHQLRRGETSAVELVERCHERIAALDPELHAVLATDPGAAAQARAADRRYARGRARPLDGVPVLVKDNIDTRGLAGTAGSPLLAAAPPPRTDAGVVALLRGAGAVMVGKTNLSEWGNYRSVRGIEGWSGVGGQTWNPHAAGYSPAGSSSGSAVAVAAGLAPLAVGTETDGSVVCPAAVTGVVGVAPERGLLPLAGIVPVSPALDTPGMFTGCVDDAVAVLAALGGGPRVRVPVPAQLRLGVWPGHLMHPAAERAVDRVAARLGALGAVVRPVELTLDLEVFRGALDALAAEFRPALEAYLATRRGGPSTLAALIEGNRGLPAPFGQDLFERAQAVTGRRRAAAAGKRARARHWARGVLGEALASQGISAIIAPTSDPAWRVDHSRGDGPARNTSTLPALAGFPHVTVPAGTHGSLPVGVSVFGPASTADVLAIAGAIEAVCGARPLPQVVRGYRPRPVP
ncbi:amidase family protein [Streptomyces sp. NPDC049813]|uniref:amidase family protein n=1 Tax=Streptomyces sp. NPDC049813 TaxID=3365597 RepID=UPI0037A07465